MSKSPIISSAGATPKLFVQVSQAKSTDLKRWPVVKSAYRVVIQVMQYISFPCRYIKNVRGTKFNSDEKVIAEVY